MSLAPSAVPDRLAVVVWLDHWHALIAHRSNGHDAVVEVERAADSEPAFLRHVAVVADDCPRVMILGPDTDRIAFDHEYETLYARGDRFVEVEACPWPAPEGLLDRLRMLEGLGPIGAPADRSDDDDAVAAIP
jgi:hypothetical protein